METLLNKLGKWTAKFYKLIKRKRIVFISLVFLFILGIVSYSHSEIFAFKHQNKTILRDTSKNTNPHVDIKVNKKYDDKGNLIQYDSVYNYTYVGKGFKGVKSHSAFRDFKSFFDTSYPEITNKMFDELFDRHAFSDSTFWDKDFFEHSMNNNWFRLDEAMRKMDSLKDDYFKHRAPRKDGKGY